MRAEYIFRILRTAGLLFALAGLGTPGALGAEEKEGVALTVYNQNMALVKENRFIELKQGENVVPYTNVAAQIEASSVHFKSLTDPNAMQVLEQNFEYDLVDSNRLLEKYVDQPIEVMSKQDHKYAGQLMSYDDQHIVVAADPKGGPVYMVRREDVRDITFPKLPAGLITKPTLVWRLTCDKPGRHLTNLTYLTNGVNWLADYVMVTNADDTAIGLSGWVTISNTSGANYENAALKLIAGEVHRVVPAMGGGGGEGERKLEETKPAPPQFAEKAFFEYHMYTLQRPTTVKDRETKQISLLSAENVPAKKVFVYNGARYDKKVRVYMEFQNKKEANLGIPLPKGNIRVYKADVDGSLEFIGEDEIDHTPKDEKVRAYLGDAFDVVGERRQMQTKRIDAHTQEQTFQIKLRNHKTDDITVMVEENFFGWTEWEITESSFPPTKKDQFTVEFSVPVAKDKESELKYTVKYVF